MTPATRESGASKPSAIASSCHQNTPRSSKTLIAIPPMNLRLDMIVAVRYRIGVRLQEMWPTGSENFKSFNRLFRIIRDARALLSYPAKDHERSAPGSQSA